MPSGFAIRSAIKASRSLPEATSTTRPSTSVDMAVFPYLAGLMGQWQFRHLANDLREGLSAVVDLGLLPFLINKPIPVIGIDQARGVPQQVLYGHRPLLRFKRQ